VTFINIRTVGKLYKTVHLSTVKLSDLCHIPCSKFFEVLDVDLLRDVEGGYVC
jgi:hypothetical protein